MRHSGNRWHCRDTGPPHGLPDTRPSFTPEALSMRKLLGQTWQVPADPSHTVSKHESDHCPHIAPGNIQSSALGGTGIPFSPPLPRSANPCDACEEPRKGTHGSPSVLIHLLAKDQVLWPAIRPETALADRERSVRVKGIDRIHPRAYLKAGGVSGKLWRGYIEPACHGEVHSFREHVAPCISPELAHHASHSRSFSAF